MVPNPYLIAPTHATMNETCQMSWDFNARSKSATAVPVVQHTRSYLALFRLPHGAQIDPELLALLVEVTAFEAESLRRVGHVIVVPPQLAEQRLALERFDSLR